MNQWIDFRELRSKLRFADVLRLYRVELNSKGDQLVGPCPLPNHPKDDRSGSFSANAERGIFQCFRCKARGNLLDFAGLMEGIDLRNGAELRRVALNLLDALSPQGPKPVQLAKPSESQSAPQDKRVLVNEPLDFRLKGLDAKHPWLLKSGLSDETIAYFGLGVAQRGYLKGRLAIPLHNLEGKLVGYAGRILDDSLISPENPKYLFPETRERIGVLHRFDPTQLLYNAHRIPERVEELVIADDPKSVWKAYRKGIAIIGFLKIGHIPEALATVLCRVVGRQPIRYYSINPPSNNLWNSIGKHHAIHWITNEDTHK